MQRILLVATIVISGLSGHAQIPPGWEIIQITNDDYTDLQASLNNCGEVAFMKRLGTEVTDTEIFLWSNGLLSRITDDDVRDVVPDVNDHGTIAWCRGIGTGDTTEIAVYQDGSITYLTDNALSDEAPDINTSSHISWPTYTGEGCAGRYLSFYDGSASHQITSDQFGNQSPAMNDADDIAWTQYNFCVNPWQATIILGGIRSATPLTSGLTQVQNARINNASQVTWQEVSGIFLWDGAIATQLTDWGSNPDINDSSLIVFSRWHEAIQTYHIWTWSSGTFTQITQGSAWDRTAQVNEAGEIVWHRGPFPNVDIVLLTWTVGHADVDQDGDVDLSDAAPLLTCIADPPHQTEPCRCHRPDLNHSGGVDLRDYTLLQVNFTGL